MMREPQQIIPSRESGALANSADLARFRRELLFWFQCNKRDLPWRENAGPGGAGSQGKTIAPYRIWISEIMLQQTRVAAVIPYYERFIAQFPTVQHLARARISSVLASWSGLGYYSRARNLHRAAKAIVAQHGGEFPRDRQAALALPGIGSYTAAAILSIAYDELLAVLDGNVARVLSRLAVIRGNLHETKTRNHLETTAANLLASAAPGDWNQAMMELGAMICTPVSPSCERCPVKRWCHAHQLGIAENLPTPRRKPRAVNISIAAAVFLDPRGRTLLIRKQNSDGALFSGLWQFPAVQVRCASRALLQKHLLGNIHEQTKLAPRALHWPIEPLPIARHTVTFRNIRLYPFLIRVTELPPLPGARTPRLDSLDRGFLPISNATRKIALIASRCLFRAAPQQSRQSA